MTPTLSWAAALLLVPIFAAADRLVGGGKRSAGMALAVAGGGLLGWAAAGPALAAGGVVWMLYRSLPFFSGSAAPTTGSEQAAAVVRHLPALLVLVPAYWAHAAGLEGLALRLGLYVIAAALLALWYGTELLKAREARRAIGSQNERLEVVRGALFGLALASYALAS